MGKEVRIVGKRGYMRCKKCKQWVPWTEITKGLCPKCYKEVTNDRI